MKTLFVTTITLAFAVILNLANAQTLDEILNKHYDAVGQDKLVATKSIDIKANITQMGTEIPIEMKIKQPDKFLITMEAQGQKVTQLFDGEKGWIIAPGLYAEPQELTGEMLAQLKQQPESIIGGGLYNYKDMGNSAELAGKVNLDGKEVYRIMLTSGDGVKKEYFIDSNTYLISKVSAKVSSGGQSINVDEYMSEYKSFDGINLAVRIIQKSPMGDVTLKIVDVKFNENYPDSIFSKPAK